MDTLLRYANFAWFRLALAGEADEAKRLEMERKLAQAQDEFEASLLTDHPAEQH
jgi:hypothetical protein